MTANAWLWLVFGLALVIMAALAAGAVALGVENYLLWQNQLLVPFTGLLGSGKRLKTHSGDNQIRCPVGKKIRILGSYFETYDPYGECVVSKDGKASTQFRKTCQGILDNNPGYSMSCDPKVKMSGCSCDFPGSCTVDGGDPKASCECAHTNPSAGFQNCACSNYEGSNPNNCKIRDNSAYLSKLCDGQNSCLVTLDTDMPDDQLASILGPFPCNIAVSDKTKMNLLPMVRGNDGLGGTQSNPMNQGYYVHGLFTCE